MSKKSPQEAKIFKKQGNFVSPFFKFYNGFFYQLFLVLHWLLSVVRCSWRSSVLRGFRYPPPQPQISPPEPQNPSADRISPTSASIYFDGQMTLFVPGRGSKANLQNSHQHLVLCPCKQVSLGSLSTGSPASHLFFREGSMYSQAHISLFQHLLASVAPCDQGS